MEHPGKDIDTCKKIWIDLDNSPHVPFFNPIIQNLERSGIKVLLTARDCQQTCGLAEAFNLNYRCIGKHHGRNKISKVAGLVNRSLQLIPLIWREKPDLAVSHGSRAQMLVAKILSIRSILIHDYEYVKALAFFMPTYLIYPEVIPEHSIQSNKAQVYRYPGIKEDIYVPDFDPDETILDTLGVADDKLIVTIRPPAVEAHYHNPASEELFEAVIDYLGTRENVQMIVLPRYQTQAERIMARWRQWCEGGKIIIPKKVMNGLDLMWYSDLVISGGGTMNREAAALGVPVYSIFKGEIGAVDRYLMSQGRLTFIDSVGQLKNQLVLQQWRRPKRPAKSESETLQSIVGLITSLCSERG